MLGSNSGEDHTVLGDRVNAECWEDYLPRYKHLKVLLVEDDDSTRHVVAALLRNCGYQVVIAANGLQAWEILEDLSKAVDLVLTDVVLPGLSGIGLLSRIMHHPARRKIPVVMMSAHDARGVVFKCLLKGAADFLVKPVRKNELKNLWQHSWRRCQSSSGSGSGSGSESDRVDEGSSSKEVRCESDGGIRGIDTQSSCTLNRRKRKRDQHQHPQSQLLQTAAVSETVHKPASASAAAPAAAAADAADVKNHAVELKLKRDKAKVAQEQQEEAESERKGSNSMDKDESCSPSHLELSLRTSGLEQAFSGPGNHFPATASIFRRSGPSAFSRYITAVKPSPLTEKSTLTEQQPEKNMLPLPYPALVAYEGGLPYFPPLPPWQHAFSPQKPDTWAPTPLPGHPPFVAEHHHHHHHHHVHHHKGTPEARAGEEPGNYGESCGVVNGESCGAVNGESGGVVNGNSSATGSNDPERSNDPEQSRAARRAAALNKFRQKRKERCFEKKVRYQTRKRLAEQRPRVRGQFVSQAAYDSCKHEF